MQQLIGALGGAQITTGKTEIGIDDAHQCQHRKMMPLGDDLRADQDIEPMRFDSRDQRRGSARAGQRVARHHGGARRRKQRANLLGESLDAGPAGGKRTRSGTRRAILRQRFGMTAMMTLQPPEEAVFDEPGRAVRTLHAMAAGMAERQRRVTPSVEEQQSLFTGGHGLADRVEQRRGKKTLSRRLVAA